MDIELKKTFQKMAKNCEGRCKDKNKGRKKRKLTALEFTIDFKDLKKKWDEQQGACSCCGIEMDLKGKTHVYRVAPAMRVSVDRIDASKGYTPDNISLVHFACNSFKQDLTIPIVFAIAKEIVANFQQHYTGVDVTLNHLLEHTPDDQMYIFPKFQFKSQQHELGKIGGEAIVRFEAK